MGIKVTKRQGKAKKALKSGTKKRPRKVYAALMRLQNAARRVEAQAADLQESIRDLREQERLCILKELLAALRNSSRGDLLSTNVDMPEENWSRGGMNDLAIALADAFSLRPCGQVGEIIQVSSGRIPAGIELDRPLCGEPCKALRVETVGWMYEEKILLSRLASPIFA